MSSAAPRAGDPSIRPADSSTSSSDASGTDSRHDQRIAWSLFLAGFATFASLYCVQPLLPVFARDFSVSPAESSLALSLTTGLLAPTIAASVGLARAWDRRTLMFGSMVGASTLNAVAGLTPSWSGVLIARGLAGLVLGGVPAAAMAHLAEEVAPGRLGRSMGLYVAGTAFGGLSGRVGMGILAESLGWRVGMVVVGLVCIASAVGFLALLPRPRRSAAAARFDLAEELRAFRALRRHPSLLRLSWVGGLLNAAFVTVFTYTTFRLTEPPHGLSQSTTSLLFLTYAFGMAAASRAGTTADRLGSRIPLLRACLTLAAGIVVTLWSSIAAVVVGISLTSIGFFAGHSVAGGTVGRLAGTSKGHASAMYLLVYYIGSSVLGSLGGYFWEFGGWNGVAAFAGALVLVALYLSTTTAETELPTNDREHSPVVRPIDPS